MAEEMKETMEQYENELEASFRKMDEGDIVEGDVLSVSDEEAVIDLKYYAQGILKASEYSDDPNVTLTEALNEGDRVKAKVISVDDGEGNIMLSKREANQVLAWDRLQKLMEEETVLSLTVGGVVNGGVIVYVEGNRGFIPASQLSLNYVEDLNTWLKKEVEAKIITVDESRNKLVLSAKEVEKAKAQEELNHKMAMMRPGMVLEGTVENIMPYGAFVDLGDGLSGLIHISQFSEKRIKSPKEMVEEGQKVKVKVLKIADNKISLSMKALEESREAEKVETGIEYKEEEKAQTSLGDLLANLKL